MSFLFLAGAVLLAIPLALMVPHTAGERYRRARQPGQAALMAPAASSPGESSPAVTTRLSRP